jgi:hypothetical protein
MFFGRKPAPESGLTLASLDARIRRIELILGAPPAARTRIEPEPIASLESALASLGRAIREDEAKRAGD